MGEKAPPNFKHRGRGMVTFFFPTSSVVVTLKTSFSTLAAALLVAIRRYKKLKAFPPSSKEILCI